MNGSTAKLLRKYATVSGHPYRDLKRIYKTYPRPERWELKQLIRKDTLRLQKLKNRRQPEQIEPVSKPILHTTLQDESRKPAAASTLPWWRVFFNWLKGWLSNFNPITSKE